MPPTNDVTERKEFFASNIRNLICATCLSENRELYSIKKLPQLANLCIDVELTETDHICWECRALLSNILKFQKKAKYALSCLLYMEENFQPGTNKFMVYNLSSLDTKLNTTYDAEFTHLFDEEQILDDLFQLTREDASDDDCMDSIEELPDLSHYPVIQNVMSISPSQLSDEFWASSKESENIESYVIDNGNVIISSDDDTDDQTEFIDEDKIQINIMGYKMMMLHRQREKRKPKFISSALNCKDCIKTFTSYVTMQKHMKVHSKKAGPYMCSICSARFKHPDALASHIKTHYSYYTCRNCSFMTFNIHKIVQHRIKYCDNEKIISNNCDDSGSFGAKDKSHEKVNTVHNNEAKKPELMITKHDHCYFNSSGVKVDKNLQIITQQSVFIKHVNQNYKTKSKKSTNSLLKRKLEPKLSVQILKQSEDPAQVEDDPKNKIGESHKPGNNYISAKPPGFEPSIEPTFGEVYKMFVSRLDV